MNINQVRYFLAIVKTKSFSEAAYESFISQSSISKQIKSLEEELGAPLFERGSYERSLTSAGQIFLKYAESVVAMHDNMLLEIEQYKNTLSGTLRIGSIPIVSSYDIGENLAAFQSIYDDATISFDMHETTQFDVLKELHSGEIDLAIVRLDNISNIGDYDTLLYAIDKMVMVCNKKHPLAGKTRVSPEEISRYPLYLLGKKSTLNYLATRPFEDRNIKFTLGGETSRHKILLQILTNSRNVSILPKALVDLNIYKQLCIVPLNQEIYSKVAMIRLKNHNWNKVTRAFWDFWSEHCTITDSLVHAANNNT